MEWDPSKPIRELPKRLEEIFSEEARILYHELESNRLEVTLIPAPDPQFQGHKIRYVENTNPGWYRNLYHSINHFRRDRSLDSLLRISLKKDWADDGFPFCSYDLTYRNLILNRLAEGHSWYGAFLPPHQVITDAIEKGIIEYKKQEEITQDDSNSRIPF